MTPVVKASPPAWLSKDATVDLNQASEGAGLNGPAFRWRKAPRAKTTLGEVFNFEQPCPVGVCILGHHRAALGIHR
jgi:hypothetical protein